MPLSTRARLTVPVGLAIAMFRHSPAHAESEQRVWPAGAWDRASAADLGMNVDLLQVADQRFSNETPLLSAALVIKRGRLVYERYGNGYEPGELFHVWSVSKSVTSIAVGIAFKEGLLSSLRQTIGELIPDRIPPGADARVWSITIEQLLTMQAGWAWDGRINFSRTAETDVLDQMLSRPFQCEPGTCFEYDSGCSNVLSAIVQQVSGELMADYLRSRLFEPLGIERYDWIVTGDGVNRGGGGLLIAPRDLARIGYLFLNGGRWSDRRIVGRRWVERSVTEQASGSGYLSGVNIGSGPYGFHWWIARNTGYQGFAALGYGGQVLYVVPDLDLVVVTGYAGADGTQPANQQRALPVIEQVIVPAATPEMA